MTLPNQLQTEQIIEACLLTATTAITPTQLAQIFDKQIEESAIERILFHINQKYKHSGIELIGVANGYKFRSRPEIQPYLNKLYQIKPIKYSRATMETLAIIAYKQPVTRAEIEDIRGVSINTNVIQTLIEREWIEVIGRKQIPGKPELLATTTKLLEDLGLNSLEDLPQLAVPDQFEQNTPADLIEEYDQHKIDT